MGDTLIHSIIWHPESRGLNKPAKVLLAPQGYTGEKHGLDIAYAPTNRVWLFCRIRLTGRQKFQNRCSQDQLKCIPLNQYKSL